MMRLAVIGSPVAHSKSPLIQAEFAARIGLNARYDAIEVAAETLAAFMERAAGEFAGFNVTMPLKEAIIPYLATVDGAAAVCRSVNTVVCRDGALHGYSTDGIGTLAALRGVFGADLSGKTALILGTGGAAKAAAFALNDAGASVTALTRRDVEPPQLSGAVTQLWSALESVAAQSEIIINATPLGMHGNAEFEDFAWLGAARDDAVVFDFVYNPCETALLSAAKTRKLRTIHGLSLLLQQAAAAFELFTGRELPHDAIALAERALG